MEFESSCSQNSASTRALLIAIRWSLGLWIWDKNVGFFTTHKGGNGNKTNRPGKVIKNQPSMIPWPTLTTHHVTSLQDFQLDMRNPKKLKNQYPTIPLIWLHYFWQSFSCDLIWFCKILCPVIITWVKPWGTENPNKQIPMIATFKVENKGFRCFCVDKQSNIPCDTVRQRTKMRRKIHILFQTPVHGRSIWKLL